YPGIVHVVELVVSNAFDPAAVPGNSALPYRTALPGFETQVYRWTFLLVNATLTPPSTYEVVCPP
ncbi:MAG TPA: hypothetical protein VLU43_14030, partial [Anaeromyxobacteraceae bacterium]|nr:hypothetical protein [Anaeromyxobacteraceae bacterium]